MKPIARLLTFQGTTIARTFDEYPKHAAGIHSESELLYAISDSVLQNLTASLMVALTGNSTDDNARHNIYETLNTGLRK